MIVKLLKPISSSEIFSGVGNGDGGCPFDDRAPDKDDDDDNDNNSDDD